MKKFFFLSFLFCTILGANAQSDTSWSYKSVCYGNSKIWTIPFASNFDICVCSHNGVYDTITGNVFTLFPDSTTTYVLVSINGNQPDPLQVYACKVTVNIPPTFTVDSIHHVTCPDPYVHGNNQIPPGPWADGSFSVTLNDSAQNYESIKVRSDSSFFFVHSYHDDFTVGGLRGGTYNIVARGTNGCEVTQHVTIQQPPAWGYVCNWSTEIYCDTTGFFSVNITGGTPPYDYEWYYDVDPNLTFPNSPTITNLDAGRYTVFAHDANGCLFKNWELGISDVITRIATDTVHLNYYTPEDSVTLIECPENMEVCQYKPFFNALSRAHGSYQWDTEFGHELDTTQNFTGPYQTGWLNVEFTDQNGCVTRDSVYLDIYDANISITTESIMNDDSVYTVTVSPLSGTLHLDGINGIEIPIGNGTISFDASQYQLGEHSFFYSGEWGDFGCYFDTTFHFTIQHQDGISEFERATRLWPNPTSNILNIEFNGEFSGDIQLFDMTGRILKTTEKISEKTSIDVSDLTSGVYFIHFVSKSGCFTKKFVKK